MYINMSDSTQNNTLEKRKKYEINKMFDLAEKPLVEYFCYFLEKNKEELNAEYNNISLVNDGIILTPIEDYNPDKYLHFKLEIKEHDYVSNIPAELNNNPLINDLLNFFTYSIQEVFESLVSIFTEDIIKILIEKSFHLEFNKKTLSFKPVYIYPLRQKFNILNECKKNLEDLRQSSEVWDKLDEKNKISWNDQISQVNQMLKSCQYSQDVADEEEKKYNEQFSKYKCIGIIFSEVPENLQPNVV